MPQLNTEDWKAFLANCPEAHILQSAQWGELKEAFGWEVVRCVSETGDERIGGQILFRRLPFGYNFAYIPKGPLRPGQSMDESSFKSSAWQAFLAEVDALCRRKRAIFLKIEPDLLISEEPGNPQKAPPGFVLSRHAIQPPRTIILDIAGKPEALLAKMKQKTRYNIRLAERKGVCVHPAGSLETFYDLMRLTGERDRFGIHSPEYYQRAYELFRPQGACELFLAEYRGKPLAAIMVFAWGKRAWYFYGASAPESRELMPTYLVQWEAIRWAHEKGCVQYDLWGVPDVSEEHLEKEFSHRNDGLWGVYRFKRGFGGRVERAAGPWDRVYNSVMYGIYRLSTRRGGES